jgi:uncharacterized protein
LRHLLAALALVVGAAPAWSQPSPAKKELVAKLLQMQRAGIEAMTRGLVERPAIQLTQEAGQIARTQVAADKRDALGKRIETRVRKYLDEAAPLLRDRALALAPTTLGATMEEKFSEDELRQLIAWLDSPLNKKYAQVAQDMQGDFVRKLLADAGPSIEPKVQALNQDIRQYLGEAAAGAAARPGPRASSAAPAAPAAAASAPAR